MSTPAVLRLCAAARGALAALLQDYGLELVVVAGGVIPGSYWGEEEAGLRGAQLFVREATPLHSVLHETAHFICMDGQRRARLDTDAGGSELEEAAVCYLQLLLAERLPGVGRARLMQDMDAWGYSFRLGSTRAWAEGDADDARAWLKAAGITDAHEGLTGRVRA